MTSLPKSSVTSNIDDYYPQHDAAELGRLQSMAAEHGMGSQLDLQDEEVAGFIEDIGFTSTNQDFEGR